MLDRTVVLDRNLLSTLEDHIGLETSNLLKVLFGDEAWRLQRGKKTRRGVRRDVPSFGSWPKGDGMSGSIPKHTDRVRSLTKRFLLSLKHTNVSQTKFIIMNSQ